MHPTVKPGQFYVVIKQCTYKDCAVWFVGSPSARYCQQHKKTRLHDLQRDWRKARDNGTIKMKGSRSRFSREEVLEMRDMFHKMPAKDIAAHFGCCVALIYRYQKKDPENYRLA
jgi:hypothetical protein